MQADIHHARPPGLTLGIERVETVFQIGEELVARIEALRRGEAHVVGVERIGDDELRAAGMLEPVGQFVVIGVGDVVEAAFFSHQPHRVDRGAARIPAGRALAGHLVMQFDRRFEVTALILGAVVAIVDPPQPVRGDLPAGVLHGRDLVG